MPIEKLKPIVSLEEERLRVIEQVVPEAFSDGRINWETLREVLGERLEDDKSDTEHFGLFWPGKREARRLASQPSKGALAPVLGEGVDEETTRNLFIEGDNLQVLKLLHKSYAGRIKVIYIDPPYNTGQDLVYQDNFTEPLEDYLKKTNQMGEEGDLLTTNAKSSGRFHSKWLNMIYPRLRVARDLLREDGVIFISIDDNEVHNLRLVMNEVFGEENFVACIVWQKMDSPSRNDASRAFSPYHDFILAYALDKDSVALRQKGKEDIVEGYQIKLADGRLGRARQLRKNGKGARRQDRPTLWYPLTAPDETIVYPIAPEGWEGRWVLSESTWSEREAAGLTRWVKRKYGWVPYYIEIAPEEPATPWPTIWTEVDQNRQAKAEFTALMGSNVDFDNPKPTNLIVDLLKVATVGDELCLDFFAGSCSTAHAVMRINREDGGSRKFVMIQLPEPTPEGSAVHQAGFETIAELGKERIRRAIQELRKQPSLKTDDTHEDLGFKVLKLQRSQFKTWQDFSGGDLAELENLFSANESPLVDNWAEQEVLTEILLLEGFPLDSNVGLASDFASNKVVEVESDFSANRLFVCLDPLINEKTIERLGVLPSEDIFICFDSALSDAAKMRLNDIGNVRTI